jgi:hypothetical protein
MKLSSISAILTSANSFRNIMCVKGRVRARKKRMFAKRKDRWVADSIEREVEKEKWTTERKGRNEESNGRVAESDKRMVESNGRVEEGNGRMA